MKIRSPPDKLRQRITDHFLIPFKHAASIAESLLRTDFFLQSLLAHPFNMHFDFGPLFRITFAKISLFTDPGHQQGVHWRKSEDQGPWCLALAKPHFWKLGYCYSHSLVPFSPAGPRAAVGGSPLHNDYNIQLSWNFREIKIYFRELEKKLSRGFPTWHARRSQLKLLTRTFRSTIICLAVYLSICLSIYLSICVPVYLWCSVIQCNVV